MRHDATDLSLVDVSAMNTNQARRTRWQEQHVAATEKLLGAVRVDDRARVDLRRHAEGNTGREVCLNQARDHIYRRPLCRQHEMNSYCTRHLRETRDRLLDFTSRSHHEVRHHVNDDDDVWQRFPRLTFIVVLLDEIATHDLGV